MVTKVKLKDLVHRPGFARKEQLLICLAVEPDKPKAVSEIRGLALGAGLKGASDWNLSAILASLPGKAVRTSAGWELTADGKTDVGRLVGLRSAAQVSALTSLRGHVSRIKSADARAFVEEAIGCAEEGFHRAAVVLSGSAPSEPFMTTWSPITSLRSTWKRGGGTPSGEMRIVSTTWPA